MRNKKKFFRDFAVTPSHSLIVSVLGVTGAFLSCHITVTNGFTYLNVSSTKINRLLQEEINATLMCHL